MKKLLALFLLTASFYTIAGLSTPYGLWLPSGSDIYKLTGNVGIGTSTPTNNFEVIGNSYTSGHKIGGDSTIAPNAGLQIVGANGISSRINLFRHQSNTGASQLILSKSRGTEAVPTAIISGDSISQVRSDAYDGTAFYASGSIFTNATENFTPTAHGSEMIFQTVKNNTVTQVTALTLGNDSSATFTGSVGIGTSPNANAILDVASTTKAFMPPRMTTAQKNAIASPTAGMMVYDTSLNKLCVYTTAWETITSL